MKSLSAEALAIDATSIEWMGAGRYYRWGSVWRRARCHEEGGTISAVCRLAEPPDNISVRRADFDIELNCARLGLPVASSYSGLTEHQKNVLTGLAARWHLPCASLRQEWRRWMRRTVITYAFSARFCEDVAPYRRDPYGR